ncbi:hypothetical protein LOD99_936 [Oopsacas minuta]|uniref:Uncharacterized protein n=1 Tax=Oopsacas minuta TaxID=111878 RepID=A0AAV7K0C9_9METZ|nr:hypothetical protein LOD99_936 [Oopsacas minuta]
MANSDNRESAAMIFKQARYIVEHDINQIIYCLHHKKLELFSQIDILEKDYFSKRNEMHKSLNTLNSLKPRIEVDLAANNLSEVHDKVTDGLKGGINKLNLDIVHTRKPGKIEIKWGMALRTLLSNIQKSTVAVIKTSPEPTAQTRTQTNNKPKHGQPNSKPKLKPSWADDRDDKDNPWENTEPSWANNLCDIGNPWEITEPSWADDHDDIDNPWEVTEPSWADDHDDIDNLWENTELSWADDHDDIELWEN